MSNDVGIKSLQKVAQLLDTFTVEKPELALGELAAACKLHPSTARRLLMSCESVGFVAQDPVTRRYRLGIKLFELGHRVGEKLELRRVARLYLKEVVESTQESAYLSLYNAGEVLYIERVESPHAVRLTSFVGQRLPAHSTGSGKVFLAHLSAEELDQLLAQPLARFTDKTICDPDQLRLELAAVRNRGYALTLEEHLEGTFSLAAPIYGQRGALVSSLGMSGPSYRVTDAQMNEYIRVLTSVARRFSLDMGARPGDLPHTSQEVL